MKVTFWEIWASTSSCVFVSHLWYHTQVQLQGNNLTSTTMAWLCSKYDYIVFTYKYNIVLIHPVENSVIKQYLYTVMQSKPEAESSIWTEVPSHTAEASIQVLSHTEAGLKIRVWKLVKAEPNEQHFTTCHTTEASSTSAWKPWVCDRWSWWACPSRVSCTRNR